MQPLDATEKKFPARIIQVLSRLHRQLAPSLRTLHSMSYEIKYENTPCAVASLARLTVQILLFAFFIVFLIRHLKRSRYTLKENVL